MHAGLRVSMIRHPHEAKIILELHGVGLPGDPRRRCLLELLQTSNVAASQSCLAVHRTWKGDYAHYVAAENEVVLVKAPTAALQIFGVLEPCHLMTLQGIPLVVVGPVPHVEVEDMDVEPTLPRKDHVNILVVLLNLPEEFKGRIIHQLQAAPAETLLILVVAVRLPEHVRIDIYDVLSANRVGSVRPALLPHSRARANI